MHPILIRLGPLSIYSYGVMVALSFSLATYLAYRRANEFKLDKNKILDLAILILVAGIIGARLLFVLLNLRHYKDNPLEVLNLAQGGLVFYGGFAAALIASFYYIRKNQLHFWNVADLIAPYIALAQAVGRLGCFLNGCCFGVEAPSWYPFSVIFPGPFILRHPTQLYSSLGLIFIFFILRIWQDRRQFEGEIFLGYCILYSIKRFSLEFLRGDNPKYILGLTFSQALSIFAFIICLSIFTYKALRWKKRPLSK